MLWRYREHTPRIDPSAFVHAAATIIGDVELGADVSVWPNVSIRGDMAPIRIGAGTSVQDGTVAHTTGGLSETHVGARVTVGHGVILHGCRVGDDCIVGMGSILLDNCEIQPWTIVGAGSLVPPRKKFPGGVLLMGRPAVVVRELTDEDRTWIEMSAKIYVGLAREYPSVTAPVEPGSNAPR
jgi:carbonic anhydrase/acetyltransferase-like protein (isoleucine patch superfamily)